MDPQLTEEHLGLLWLHVSKRTLVRKDSVKDLEQRLISETWREQMEELIKITLERHRVALHDVEEVVELHLHIFIQLYSFHIYLNVVDKIFKSPLSFIQLLNCGCD